MSDMDVNLISIVNEENAHTRACEPLVSQIQVLDCGSFFLGIYFVSS